LSPETPTGRKAYKGIAMEGIVAKQYARVQKHMIEQYKIWAKLVSGNVASGSNILELAPGPGYLSVELAKLGNYNITGLDISKTFVKIAQNKAKESEVKIDFRQGDAAETPFPDETFDFIICTSAFKNFPQPVKVIDEIFRILGKRGKALIIDMRKDAPKEKLDEFVDRMKLNMFNSFFTKSTFKSLAKSAYTRGEIQNIVKKSKFIQCKIVDEDIGFEIWLDKFDITTKATLTVLAVNA
jgi:ubiquinone/menaquinone biosynthesis C-methylase UbiE